VSVRIDVWICARPGRRLEAVHAALAAAGALPRVATAPAGQGLAAARNEALARCDGEVLALVEDDVEVDAGWLAALEVAWSGSAAERLGCVGGPLHATFADDRPDWLGDDLLPALGVDRDTPPAQEDGGAPVPVDAARRTFHGGNISFRATALRGVGGFWPARGHPGLRDWYGEEHRAQHELARAGWSAAWAPGASAARRIEGVGPLDVVGLRARAGTRAGAVGAPSPRSDAARKAATAAAGVLVAAARCDASKLVERAARAAQHGGELAAPLLAHRSLQPATTRTPFAYSVPPAAPSPLRAAVRRRAARARGGPLVLLYHRVAAERPDPMALMVSPEHFAEQLELLSARRAPVPLEEIVAGEAPSDAVAVTFDDGYVDVYDAALPALEAAGVPATVFVSTGHVESGRAFWWDAVARLLRAAPANAAPLELAVDGNALAWPARDEAERAVAFRCVAAWLHAQRPEAIEAALQAMAQWARVDDPLAPAPEDRPMTVDELRRLAASPVVTIGSHGRHHPCLAALTPERQAADLTAAREDLADWLGHPPAGLAYPYGVPGVDVDAATREAARAAGHAYAVVNTAGALPRRADRMAFPRAAVPDVGADAFDAWLRERAVSGHSRCNTPIPQPSL
jgi:peptidoglycan/xylan/chitin deacetylase (PgdA/CDA1 family)